MPESDNAITASVSANASSSDLIEKYLNDPSYAEIKVNPTDSRGDYDYLTSFRMFYNKSAKTLTCVRIFQFYGGRQFNLYRTGSDYIIAIGWGDSVTFQNVYGGDYYVAHGIWNDDPSVGAIFGWTVRCVSFSINYGYLYY